MLERGQTCKTYNNVVLAKATSSFHEENLIGSVLFVGSPMHPHMKRWPPYCNSGADPRFFFICLNLTYIWYCYHLWGLPDLVVFSIHFKYGKSILSVDFNSWGMSAVTFGLKFHTSNNQITQAGNMYMFIYSFTVTHKGCSYMWIGWHTKERAAILADNRWQTKWYHPKPFAKSPTPLMPFYFSWS